MRFLRQTLLPSHRYQGIDSGAVIATCPEGQLPLRPLHCDSHVAARSDVGLTMAMGAARKLVVVVDDDPGVLKAVGRLLKAHGLEHELFSSVHDFHGRAQLERSTCLILDINLNGESGIDLRRKLSETWPSIPVIFITANDNEGSRQAAMDTGCLAYLVKPFPAKSLLDAVQKASAEPQCRLPLVRASATPREPRRVISPVYDFACINHIQAELERKILRRERENIWARAEGAISESEELLREADTILASRNLIFLRLRRAKRACAAGESGGTLRMTASTRTRKN